VQKNLLLIASFRLPRRICRLLTQQTHQTWILKETCINQKRPMRETSCLSSCRDAKSSRQICQMWWSKETWTHQKRRIRQTSCLSFCRDAKSSRQILAQICRMCQMWKLKETCMNQKRPMRETSCLSFCRDAKSGRQIVAQICRMCHVLINRDANTSKKTYSNKPLQECQRCQMWTSEETYTDQNGFIKETSCLWHRLFLMGTAALYRVCSTGLR